jgi:hypothetical protein
MNRLLIALCLCAVAQGHDLITTPLLWNREISRLVFAHCVTCHHPDGRAFSLMTYEAARPWAEAIKDEVRERRMPPWGAVKGFGDFRNDQGLTQEEIDLIAGWVDGGAPEGDDPKDLPPAPEIKPPAPPRHSPGELVLSGEFTFARSMLLGALWPTAVPQKASLQITAELPDGSVLPLVWLYGYKTQFEHEFLLRNPLNLPAGTKVHGIPAGSRISLFPAVPRRASPKTGDAFPKTKGPLRSGQ